ncbi:DUF6415 family natural product biosynthesis protein [Streptomyces sp. NPDC048644]|uniref:DUF6415 family natural product biosynthesis protein n=1 Tax=Streptomyces sp. NPDC048644 TaxID=3365582 RepID=UPI003723AF1E
MRYATTTGEPMMQTHPPEPESLQIESYPVDAETITATIDEARALRGLAAKAGDLDIVATTLRGHIALLLPEIRGVVDRLWHGSIETHRLTARLDGIENQAKQAPRPGTLAAHVQVQQLARDCQWLLARHTGGVA